MNIAIISPSQNAYSETFIQAHKNKLKGNIKYYYGGSLPSHLEGKGFLKANLLLELTYRLQGKVRKLQEERLFKSFKDEKINIVLAEYGTTAVEIISTCKKLNIPLIVHFHGFDASVHKVLENNKEKYNEVFSYASSIIAVSNAMRKKLIAAGAPDDKLVLNTYGPNEEYQKVTPTFEKNNFIAIGRFVDKKAPYYTILAFKEVAKMFPEAKLIFGGDGPLLETCKNLVKIYNLHENIIFKGILNRQEVINEMSSALAFVQHSITAANGDMEGTPLSILESSSAGLPVISTYHAGIPDVIINNETGLLCKEHDVAQMASNMIQLIENSELAKKMGKKGRTRIQNYFSLGKHINRLDELIEEAYKTSEKKIKRIDL